MKDEQYLTLVAEIYGWLDLQTRCYGDLSGGCKACGCCCDFESFGHRLFVTSPELMYLAAKIGHENIKPMKGGRCPYNIDGKCTIYENRFAGCRVFSCKADKDFQHKLSEISLKRFKMICEDFEIPYDYSSLADALNSFAGD
ncbi:MAG: hypothetical protein KAS75_01455 [Planctomycetes bacterium]|nr:hypothetical protein [Planctomycetota bacterium]